MQTLRMAIKKVNECKYLSNQIEWMLNDIENYLNGGDLNEGMTTQSIIGMNVIFQGLITKNWKDLSTNQPKNEFVK